MAQRLPREKGHSIGFSSLTRYSLAYSQMGTDSQSRETTSVLVPIILFIIGILLWLGSLPGINLREMDDLGLLSVLPLTFIGSIVLLTINFAVLVHFWAEMTAFKALHVFSLIFIIHGTPSILYKTLRYSWAWKHVGIVDFIEQNGGINPYLFDSNIYHNWPGFFGLNALLTQAAGLENAIGLATWSPVFFNTVFFLSIYLLYSALTTDRRLIWTSIWFFSLANWVGQDYFAPQAFTFFLYLVTISILLRWFQYPTVLTWRPPKALSGLLPGHFWYGITQRLKRSSITHPTSPNERVLAMAIAILLMIVITFSHQLTPILMIISFAFLVVFRRVYPQSLPILMGAIVIAWIWFVATPYVREDLPSIIDSIGAVENNLSDNLINLAMASRGQVVIAIMGRILTGTVILLGMVGFLWRYYNGYLDLAPVLLAIAPGLLLAGNSYGGEILFRIYLFAMPFLVFGIGSLIYTHPDRVYNRFMPVVTVLLSVALLIFFMFAYYGKEKQFYITPEEIAATDFLYRNAVPGSLIIEANRNYPLFYQNREHFVLVDINSEPVESRVEVFNDPVNTLDRWMRESIYPGAYIIFTRSQKAENDMVGDSPPGTYDQIEEKLRNSEKFIVLFENVDAVIFTLKGREQ